MMNPLTFLESKKESVGALCQRYGVRRLRVFGSALRPDWDEEASDFDKAARAVLALLPGRSEAAVKAEAVRETVARVRQVCAGMPGSPLALWLSQLEADADRIEAQP